jgi:uncharacterized membrane protein
MIVYSLVIIGFAVITEFITLPTLKWILSFGLTTPLALGFTIAFLNFVSRNEKIHIPTLFDGFKYYLNSITVHLWFQLWTALWSLLFIIPGIIKSIAYSQMYYIVAENPSISVKKAMKTSIKITHGYKMSIFVLGLSFFGWGILTLISFGIGSLWLAPYVSTTMANLYLKLKEISLDNGTCTIEDFQ